MKSTTTHSKKKSPSSTPMQKTLYLTKEEQKLFEAFSASMREGWTTAEENQTYEDSPYKRSIRLEIMRLKSPVLQELQKKAQGAKDEQEFMAIVDALDLGTVQESDLHQLLFGLGPDAVSVFIRDAFANAKTDEDVQSIAALSQVRHIYLESLLSASHS